MKRRGLFASLVIGFALLAGLLVACSKPATYTLTFVTPGDPIAPITAEAGAQITPPADPVLSGHVFCGWYLNEDFEGEAQTLPTVMPSESRTYYARFEGTYVLTLDPNGGTLSTTSYEVPSGTRLLDFLQDVTPTRTGVRFAGWYIGNRALLASDLMTAAVTLVAKWEAPYTAQVYLQQLNEEKTAATDTYLLSPEHAVSGWAILGEPFNAGAPIDHYELNAAHAGSVTQKVIEESGNAFTLYYSRAVYTIHYIVNASDLDYEGEMEDERYPYGATAQIKPCAYTRAGYLFAGWSQAADKFVTPPTTAFVVAQNYYIYALWDRGYRNEADETDIVYLSSVVTVGLGRAYRFDNGEKKEGFLETNEYTGVLEFTFYYDEGDKIGRIDQESGTFMYRGEEEGVYLCYDYVTGAYTALVLYLDGYGDAVHGVVVGGGLNFGNTFGTYAYEAQYDDYRYTYIDIATGEETGDHFNFRLSTLGADAPTGTGGFAGSFLLQGEESGSHLLFDVFTGELVYECVLELDGYGNAREKAVTLNDALNQEEIVTLSEGTYAGTANYTDPTGEWAYTVHTGEGSSFRFILSWVAGEDEYISVYLVYDERIAGTLAAHGNGSGRLVLSGYNAALYYPSGLEGNAIEGSFLISGEVNLAFVPYVDGEAAGLMLFVVEWAKEEGEFIGTFTLNEDDFIVDVEGTLTGYLGTSPFVEIPDRVVAIADDALSYLHIETSLRSVVIPASVQSIGKRAFENNYTLSQAVFLSEVPIAIDWSSTVNPFRWPKGDFAIIVPEGCEETYRAAWQDCPYTITSFTERNNRPEWEIEGNVLVAYNNKVDDPHDLDLKIPDEVTEIAARVFFALDYIRSINLNNVTVIGEDAFSQCSALETVLAPHLQTVSAGAFALCESLETITLPKAVTLGDEAFAGCYLLTRVTLGAQIASIGTAAFAYCGSESTAPTLFVVFEGTRVPTIGGNAFYGCVARRISVDTINTALSFLSAPDWRSYALSLWVRAAAESEFAGEWVDLATLQPVLLNGRAELFLFEIWLYDAKDSYVTFYISDESPSGYSTVYGTYENGVVAFRYEGVDYRLIRTSAPVTYVSGDEMLTLDLSSATFDDFPFIVPATLNGTPITLSVSFSKITATGVIVEGKRYAFTFALKGDRTFSYTKRLADTLGPYTASDGSTVSFRYDGGLIYGTGSLKVDGNTITGTVGWYTVQESETTYNITIPWREKTYLVTVTVTGEDTFTYTWALGSSRKVIYAENNAGAVVAVYDKSGAVTTLQLMLPSAAGGANEMVEATYERQEDGSYLFTVNFTVEIYDEAANTVHYEPSPLNGTYLVTVDFEGETCTIVKIA